MLRLTTPELVLQPLRLLSGVQHPAVGKGRGGEGARRNTHGVAAALETPRLGGWEQLPASHHTLPTKPARYSPPVPGAILQVGGGGRQGNASLTHSQQAQGAQGWWL